MEALTKPQLVKAWSTGQPINYNGKLYGVNVRAPRPYQFYLTPGSYVKNENQKITKQEIWLEETTPGEFKAIE